jgi:SAM-dependent methyltransferase
VQTVTSRFYSAALGTRSGYARQWEDPHRLSRIDAFDIGEPHRLRSFLERRVTNSLRIRRVIRNMRAASQCVALSSRAVFFGEPGGGLRRATETASVSGSARPVHGYLCAQPASPSQTRNEWCCPACGYQLSAHASSWKCSRCGQAYNWHSRIPDFRSRSDVYLTIEEDRAKAARLSELGTGVRFSELARAYYAATEDVDDTRRRLYLAHLDQAEARGATLLDLLPDRGRVLEVGCGSGGLLVAAAQRGIKIQGVDIALRWLVLAQRRLADRGFAVPVAGADAAALPARDQSFDAVVADSVVEHLEDLSGALQEWYRVVKPGGRLVLLSPNRCSAAHDPHVGLWGVGYLPRCWAPAYVRMRRGCSWRIRPRSSGEMAYLATAAGWRDVRVEAPRIPMSWARSTPEQRCLKLYNALLKPSAGRRALRLLGPMWQLVAHKGLAA